VIEVLDTDIDVPQLQKDMNLLLGSNSLWDRRQVSLTSITGEDDWDCSVGTITGLKKPERLYSVLNKSLQGTYMGDLIQKYNLFYRWRLLCVAPGQTYSVHRDALGPKLNKRIHIPIITNPGAFFCFYDRAPADCAVASVRFHNLLPGLVYELNTTGFHTAVNHGSESRYHIVGVRYEDVR
jgi:hypothetical protein